MREKCRSNLMPSANRSKTRKWRSRRGKLFGLLLLPLMASCQSTIRSDGIDAGPSTASFCQAARAIYYSRHDTKLTIEQIREHNAVGLALKCGWTGAKGQKAAGK